MEMMQRAHLSYGLSVAKGGRRGGSIRVWTLQLPGAVGNDVLSVLCNTQCVSTYSLIRYYKDG